MSLIDSARLPEATRRKARFAMQLMNDAYAPSNIPWLNPGVVKEATETQGQSLVRGMENFLDDSPTTTATRGRSTVRVLSSGAILRRRRDAW